MNYAQYLKNGNQLAEPAVETRLGEKEVNQLVQRIIQGDKEAATILVENAIKDPENAWITNAIQGAQSAAEQGNELAIKFWEIVSPLLQLATQAQSMKCGGKVRAKIKKACSGKKMEKGGEALIKKEAKGGKPCPCTMYKKVGGKLQLVDCSGIPMAKDGTIMKFLPGGQFRIGDQVRFNGRMYQFDPREGWYALDGEDADAGFDEFVNKEYGIQPSELNTPSNRVSIPTKSSGYVFDPTGALFRDPILERDVRLQLQTKAAIQQRQKLQLIERENQARKSFDESFQMGGLNYGRPNPYDFAKQVMAKPEPVENIWNKNAENYSKQAEEYATQKLHEQHPGLVQKKEQPQTTWRDTFGAGKAGKFGGLTYDEAIARQKEMAAAQGFNANFGRQDGMWGQKSKAEWERYQAWKQQQADLAQRKADREAAGPLLSRPAVQAQAVQQSVLPQTLGYDKMGTDERFVKQGYASGRPWTDAEIKNMDPAQALYLNDEDYRRYLGKTFTNTLQPPMYAYNVGGYNIPDYSAFFRKQGGLLNYAQYLNLK